MKRSMCSASCPSFDNSALVFDQIKGMFFFFNLKNIKNNKLFSSVTFNEIIREKIRTTTKTKK